MTYYFVVLLFQIVLVGQYKTLFDCVSANSLELVVCILTSMFCHHLQSETEAKLIFKRMFFHQNTFRVEPCVNCSPVWWKRLNSDQPPPPTNPPAPLQKNPIIPWKHRNVFAFSAMVLEWQKWGGTRGVFFLVCSDLCLDSCMFLQHLFQKKKGITCLLLSRVIFACCVVQAPPKVESSLISGPSCRKLCRCTQKKKKRKKSHPFFATSSLKFHSVGF